MPRHPGRLNRLVLAVAASAHASAAALMGVAALSPGLRTPLLPVTHAWVGYGWQNSWLYHLVRVQQLHEQPRVAPVSCYADCLLPSSVLICKRSNSL